MSLWRSLSAAHPRAPWPARGAYLTNATETCTTVARERERDFDAYVVRATNSAWLRETHMAGPAKWAFDKCMNSKGYTDSAFLEITR